MWCVFGDPPFVLKPKHAAAFRAAAESLSDSLGWEDSQHEDSDVGIQAFDSLSQGQKQAAILLVSRALLDSAVEPPRVTAAVAATVDAIYCELQGSIEIEIDIGEETTIRSLVLAAMDECNYWQEINEGRGRDEEEFRPWPATSRKIDDWAELIESLREEVLEDYDFDMEDQFLDLPPEAAAKLKRDMNILPDYFTAVPEDPKPDQLARIRLELRALLRSPIQRTRLYD